MSRVLVTGGAGMLGAAVVRRLLADPAYEVRVADDRPVPQWMREGAEIHAGPLGDAAGVGAALAGCTHVVHIGCHCDGAQELPLTAMTRVCVSTAAALAAAADAGIARFVHVSSGIVFERAETFPTPEEALLECPAPRSPIALAELTGEALVRAAHEQHGLPFAICRAVDAYGPAELPDAARPQGNTVLDLAAAALANDGPLRVRGAAEQTRTPTHVDDICAGIVAAISAPAAENEDLNLAAPRELPVGEIAAIVWQALGRDPKRLELEAVASPREEPPRRWPAAAKAREQLGWEARIAAEEGIAATVRRLCEQLARPPGGGPPAGSAAAHAPGRRGDGR